MTTAATTIPAIALPIEASYVLRSEGMVWRFAGEDLERGSKENVALDFLREVKGFTLGQAQAIIALAQATHLAQARAERIARRR